MTGSKSAYLEKVCLDTFIGGFAFSAPSTLYVALFTTGSLTDQSTGSTPIAIEVTGGSYARAPVVNNSTNWPAAVEDASTTSSKKINGTAITFTQATSSWGQVSSWAVLDAVTAGNIYYYGTFDVPKNIVSGDAVTLAAGALTFYEG